MAATGDPAPSLLWKRNGFPIPGATSSTYTITSATGTDNGWYQVVASNSAGTALSPTIFVNVAVRQAQVFGWGSNDYGQLTVPAGLTDVVAVAAGGYQVLALKADGTVVGWGRNDFGQIDVPPGLTDVVRIAAAGNFTLALKSDGKVVGWGYNNFGQATGHAGLTNVVDLAAGGFRGYALRNDGTLVSWGAYDTFTPETITLSGVADVVAGSSHNLALMSDGRVFTWGFGGTSVPANLAGVVGIAAGGDRGSGFSLALKNDGTVVGWGANNARQLPIPSDLASVIALAASPGLFPFAMALRADGTVVAWGDNLAGESDVPVGAVDVVDVSAGADFAIALRDGSRDRALSIVTHPASQTRRVGQDVTFSVVVDGYPAATYQWRRNGVALPGRTGSALTLRFLQPVDAANYDVVIENAIGSLISNAATLTMGPSIITSLPTPRQVVTAGQSLTLTGTASAATNYQWRHNGRPLGGATSASHTITSASVADNGWYQLVADDGTGPTTSAPVFVNVNYSDAQVLAWGDNAVGQVDVPADLTDVVSLAAGGFYTIALRGDGTVIAWGGGSTPIVPPNGLDGVVGIAAGSTHAIALKSNGTVVAWGTNYNGESTVPVGLNDVVAISAAGPANFALRANGTVVGWGYGGQVTVPATLVDVVAVATGSSHGYALKNDGSLFAWGDGLNRTIVPDDLIDLIAISAGESDTLFAFKGDGSVSGWNPYFPSNNLLPSDLDDIVAVEDGGQRGILVDELHTLALTRDGTVLAWGNNAHGEITLPAGLENVVALAASVDHSVALRDGSSDTLPAISAQPAAQVTRAGQTVSFTVVATGRPTPTYQWRRNGVEIPNASQATFTLTSAQPADAGSYDVVLTNRIGSVVSNAASLTVNPSIITAISAPRQFVPPGQAFTLQVSTDPTLGTTFQWKHNSRPLPGATSAALTRSGASHTDEGWYEVDITDAGGVTHSPLIFVRVVPAATQVFAWGDNGIGQATVPAGLVDPVAVAAGSSHSLALRRDGTVVAWGENQVGETDVPPGLADVVRVCANYASSAALRSDGTIVVWGGTPLPPAGLKDVADLAVGYRHSLALKHDGSVVAWGENANGECEIPPSLSDVVQVAVGDRTSFALKRDGTVVGWGDSGFGKTTIPSGLSGVTSIACGGDFTNALKSDGTVVAWGANDVGQADVPPDLADVVALAALELHSIGLKGDGTVRVWGYGDLERNFVPSGLDHVVQVAIGTSHYLVLRETSQDTPPVITANPVSQTANSGQNVAFSVSVSGASLSRTYQWRKDGVAIPGATDRMLALADVRSVDAGAYDVVVANLLGSVTSGPASLIVNPAVVSLVSPVRKIVNAGETLTLDVEVSAGQSPTFQWTHNGVPIPGAIMADLTIAPASARDNGWYQLLVNPGADESRSPIVFVGVIHHPTELVAWVGGADNYGLTTVPSGLGDVISIASGLAHALALKAEGTVAAWGYNYSGQTIVPSGLTDIVALAGGYQHSLALKSDGTVAGWGSDSSNQASGGAHLTHVVQIACGLYHSLALRSDGRVIAWGRNDSGQVTVPNTLTDVIRIAAGGLHSVALRSDGTVIAWGAGEYGQTTVPPNLHDATEIAAGSEFNLALRRNGTVVAWGRGHTQPPLSPTNVPAGLTDVVEIRAGSQHSLALKVNGAVVAWGEFGFGTTANVPDGLAPVIDLAAGSGSSIVLRTPLVVVSPVDQTVIAGQPATFVAAVVGGSLASYQWQFRPAGGAFTNIMGATSASHGVPSVQRFHDGNYRVVVTIEGITAASPAAKLTVSAPPPNNARLLNLSTRGLAQTGDSVLIPGFVISGRASKQLLLRAVGPTLAQSPFNLAGTLPDPRMTLKRLDTSMSPAAYVDVAANDNWQTNANAAAITTTAAQLFAFPFADAKEAALLVDLPPGQYTVTAGDTNNASGIAIVELYDANPDSGGSELINISNRGFAGVGDQVMIPGFVVSSEGPKTILARVVGPRLAADPFNVPGTMADPKLEVFPGGASTPILTNDNWGENLDAAYTAQVAQQVFAFPLAAGSKDAAFVVTLPPGSYTVVGSSAIAGGTGVVLVEVYVVP